MTILKGEQYIVESLSQFRDYLDVSDAEIANALPEEIQELMLTQAEEVAQQEGAEPVTDVEELAQTNILSDAIHHEHGLSSTIIDVLEARDGDYIHLYDGTVHTIVEIHPDQS
jgi:mannose-6-phosphate isomerase class I